MTRFERWAVWGTSIATVLTGVVYLWMKYLLVNDDPFAVVNHPLQPFVLKAHIIVAPLLTFAIGLVALRHIWRHVTTGVRRGRRTGLTMALMTAPMILTGYLIQAMTQEGWLKAMAYSHIAFGLVYAVGLLAHHFAVGGQKAERPSGALPAHPPRRRGRIRARLRPRAGSLSSQSSEGRAPYEGNAP